MKKYKIIITMISIIFIISLLFETNALAIGESSNTNNSFNVEITYEKNIVKNTVTVKAVSDRELIQKTLSGWILGEDKKTYTAEYDKNQTFSTYFTDTNGNKVLKEIKITEVDDKGPEVNISYSLDKETNKVTVTASANEKMRAKTLAGWKLSQDQMSFTAEYNTNQTFNTNFTDLYGNKTEKQIVINQITIDVVPIIDINYEYNSVKNTVVVRAVSNRELVQKTLPGWVLGADKKTYTAEYDKNQTFNTYFTDIYGNKVLKEIKIDKVDEKGPVVSVNYKSNSDNSQVTVTVVSNEKMKAKTLAGWKLSQDQMSFTATYDINQTFITYFTDVYGNKTEQKIVINQVRTTGVPTVDISYEYNSIKNTVIVKAVSNRRLIKKTLSGWILGADEKTYTAECDRNQTFSTYFTDIYGNKVLKEIKITEIDDKGPEVNISYNLNKNTNKVTVTASANEKMRVKTLTGWKLSQDQKTFTAEYNSNQTFNTYFTDLYGNKTEKQIKITEIDDVGPVVKVAYSFDNLQTKCVVTVTSNEEMKPKTLAGWTLSEDKLYFTATYTSNQIFKTNFTDKWGNVTSTYINIAFDKGIDVSSHNGEINWQAVKDSGIAFAIIRCGYGENVESQDDKNYIKNISECERLGVPYGVYLYSYALNENGALSEAEHALRLLKGHNPTYGVWIDMEDADTYKERHGMPSNETLVNICSVFCDKLIENGYSAGIYASYYWLTTYLNDAKLDKYDKWVAQWNVNCSYNKKYIMWQYTSLGRVDGISTNVDMNIYYK